MATLKQLSRRLKSVINIQKITKSMKMVSASKYSRAERDLRQARPLGEGTQLFFEKLEATKMDVKQDSSADNIIIAISSDRGLCGSVHAQVSKVIKAELGNSPGETKLICVGDKSRALLQNHYKNNIVLVAKDMGRRPPTFLDASEIAFSTIKYRYAVGKIVYNKFKSIVSNSVSQIEFYSENAVVNAPKSLIYELGDSDLDSYLEFSLASLIFYSLKENACSEQASRMSAMDNATRNAGDMINMITLRLNRTRQAVITRELIEIISGASALK